MACGGYHAELPPSACGTTPPHDSNKLSAKATTSLSQVFKISRCSIWPARCHWLWAAEVKSPSQSWPSVNG